MHLGIRKSRGPRRNCRKAIGQTSLERRPTHSKLRRVPTPLNIWSTGSEPSDIAIPDTSFNNCEEEIYSTPDKQRREDVVQIKASGNSSPDRYYCCMVAGASPAYNVEEMTYALKTADAKFLMTSPGSIEVAAAAAQKVGIPRKHIFLLEGEVQGYITFKQLQDIGRSYGENGQAPPFQLPVGRTNKELCGFLNFSSGTTGLPKAVAKQSWVPYPFSTISELVLVPPLVIRLVNDPIASKYDLSCVKRISCGAAPLSEQITQLLQQKFPQSGFKQGYGMTESCSCITSHSPKYYDYKYANTVGDIVPSTTVKIIDDNGKELGYNQPGEIIAKGPQIAMGYLGNPTATAEAFDTDGFLHTGDIGYMTEEGLIRIVDRIKEMIKVKGIAVAPAELEDLLLGHPDVADCAVLGVKDDYAGEKPKAYVVLRDGLSVSEEMGKKLMKYVSERKVRFKWVEEIEFTDAVPKSPSGKILRRVLREKERSGKDRGFTVKRDGWDGQRAKL
ncbi:long-chain-fatty-acid-CoA ligase [Coccidioides immitis RMSCC 3703]|uniref:Long-chain-fatty-acid-CoA ligase n=1 Tax=Coccidioides immitis RMSCC 3703 TaxID=454286 RepID=A0A0J8TSN4_COCIT|nr:long-chain-fatty-acid-CoA ligase [Coccidioides immitis RMSCC 3703]